MSTTGDPLPHRTPDRTTDRGVGPTAALRTKAPGRPQDVDLTRRLLETALVVTAERGYRHRNGSNVSDLAGAGKAGLYRRWADTTALLAEAVAGAELVQTPPRGATLQEDLTALLSPWTRALTVRERAAAAVLGPALHEPALRAALDIAVTDPLAAAATAIIDREVARGNPVTPAQRRTFQHVVRALWLDRCCTPEPPSSAEEVRCLVDHVLGPILRDTDGDTAH